jgi:mRNA interferase MazF
MKRGEIWTLRDDGYASKARPAVIVQSDRINQFDSVILCLFTTFLSDHISTRTRITADLINGLKKDSYVMTEKIITVDKRELGEKIGTLTAAQMSSISSQLANILDIQETGY